MAHNEDPLVGSKDAWRGDVVEAGKDRLFHNDASYYSQLVRLALAEKAVSYTSRHMELLGKHEQASKFLCCGRSTALGASPCDE